MVSAVVMPAATPSSTHSTGCGSTRGAVASLDDWWPTQTMSAAGVMASPGPTTAELRPKWMPMAPLMMFDVESTFCYLGDMLCSDVSCDNAIAARCCVAWGKFRKPLPVQTTRHLSPKIRGNVWEACIGSAMLHGSKTWPNTKHLHQTPTTVPWASYQMGKISQHSQLHERCNLT